MKFLHITVDKNEPITKAILQQKKSKWIVLTLHDFMKSVNIYDQSTMSGTLIEWQYYGMILTNNKETLLSSRICHIPTSLFDDFNVSDRQYAQSEMEAYLGFSLNAFTKLDPLIDERGCIPCYSLPQQWHLIRSNEILASVPEYYWGDPKFNHLKGSDLIYSGIYEYGIWSTRHLSLEKSNSIFCFEQPIGIPVICFVINGNVLLLDSDNKYMGHHKDIKYIARQLAKMFCYFSCEILLFVGSNTVTVGCISPYVIQSHWNDKFSQFVNDAFWEITYDSQNYVYS